jgi:hypothetical protein
MPAILNVFSEASENKAAWVFLIKSLFNARDFSEVFHQKMDIGFGLIMS